PHVAAPCIYTLSLHDALPILVGHSNLATVAKSQLERAGFKVDLQAMDWQTLVTRRTKKDPPQAGGWHAFFTSSAALSIADPVAQDRKSTRLNSSHGSISYAVF